MDKIMKNVSMFALVALSFVMLLPAASAALKLDNIYFDPAIVAAGDEVDIVVQYHNDLSTIEEEKFDNGDFTFHVTLEPDDTITQRYVTMLDSEGDDLHGAIYSGDKYNKRFRVKVAQDAPAGNYQFELVGRWYEDGVPESTTTQISFRMPVKKEGIVLGVGSFISTPAEVRPGDDYVQIDAFIENSGQKDAKAIELTLHAPEGIQASYTNNNRVWVGRVNAGQSKQATFFVDVDENLEPDAYDLRFSMDYADTDDNSYQSSATLPFLVKPRPHLEVVSVQGTGVAGKTATLAVTIKNTGSEEAESVDVRVLKQSVQPFNMDVRSDYIGSLDPGEEGVALFELDVSKDASIKEHDIKLILRAKGDTDAGDDNIYTFNRDAKFPVTGKAPNNLLFIGIALLVVVVIVTIIARRSK